MIVSWWWMIYYWVHIFFNAIMIFFCIFIILLLVYYVSFVQIEEYFYLSAVIETEWTWTGLLKGWIFYCAEGKIFLLGYDWKIICSENDINGIGKLVISFLFHEENGFYKMSTHVWYYFFFTDICTKQRIFNSILHKN